jgi:hypothetical protein
MTTNVAHQRALLDPDDYQASSDHPMLANRVPAAGAADSDEPPHPVNWNLLNAEQAEAEWLDLNAWVNWLRRTYGLSPTVIPPYWHRHDELVWELSALHTHWLNAYDPDGSPSAPLGWHRDFADARHRLREWVSTCGTKLDRDRPTRLTTWPGEDPPSTTASEVLIDNRDADFVAYVLKDTAARRQAEQHAQAITGAFAASRVS